MMTECPSESDDEHVNANYSVKSSGCDVIDTEMRHKRRLL
jgi:hypothetical protein